MEAEDGCNTGLVLTIGSGQFSGAAPQSADRRRKEPVQLHLWFSPKEDQRSGEAQDSDRSGCNKLTDEEDDANNRSYNNQERSITRKKLRLTKEQSNLLEDSFKEHSTLTPTQKKELAAKLNLRPRQVEVWFQNRRARTKLKQMEVDCELLKECCETLSDENRRLKKELQDLRSVNHNASPFFVQLQREAAAGSMAVCPSCERVTPMACSDGNVLDGPKPKLLLGALKDTSMAC